MGVFIHITAVSPYFESHEIIAQSKAVNRLVEIRKGFEWYNCQPKYYGKFPDAKLKVITGVHNPELPFKY